MNGRTNVVNNNSDSLGGIIPLEAPINFVVVADNAKCLLTWTDPKDKYADELGEITDEGDQLVSQFAYTRIVRKTTGYPSGPNDGDIVTESSTRNQYQSTAYSDEGLVNNTLYYYAAFTCNTDGVWSGSITGSATPKAYDPILANNTWEQINEVANEGIAASVWSIGDEIDIIALNETLTMVILDFDHDDLSDGSGTAAITFGMKNLMAQTTIGEYGGKSNGVVEDSMFLRYRWGLDNFYTNEIYNSIQDYSTNDYLNSIIQNITKKSIKKRKHYYDSESTISYETNNAPVWMFSETELVGRESTNTEDGILYPYYTLNASKIKRLDNGNGENYLWTLRGCSITILDGRIKTYQFIISEEGNRTSKEFSFIEPGYGSEQPKQLEVGICFGFCIGKTPS